MSSNRPARAVLMVRPTSFGFDEQTAESNAFQHRPTANTSEIRQRAAVEFQHVVDTLSSHGVEVMSFEDSPVPPKPNAVFPNNWLSTWPDGRIFLYPMATASRRIERSNKLVQSFKDYFKVSKVIDLSTSEKDGLFLESTGVIIFDHAHKIMYGCVSLRCDANLFTAHAKMLGYTPVIFNAYSRDGVAIYHTNILMGIQSSTAIVCLAAITDANERANLVRLLEKTDHDVIDISYAQMDAFCANSLELENQNGERFLALSQTAYDNFTPQQRKRLAKDKALLPIAVPTIEAVGGGSVRCMLAEIFLEQIDSLPIVPSMILAEDTLV